MVTTKPKPRLTVAQEAALFEMHRIYPTWWTRPFMQTLGDEGAADDLVYLGLARKETYWPGFVGWQLNADGRTLAADLRAGKKEPTR